MPVYELTGDFLEKPLYRDKLSLYPLELSIQRVKSGITSPIFARWDTRIYCKNAKSSNFALCGGKKTLSQRLDPC